MGRILNEASSPLKLSSHFQHFPVLNLGSGAGYDKGWSFTKSAVFEGVKFVRIVLSDVLFGSKPTYLTLCTFLFDDFFQLFDLLLGVHISFSDDGDHTHNLL